MSLVIAEVYEAFLEAGAPEDKARKAAEVLASCSNRCNTIEQPLAAIQRDVTILTWMVGFTLALNVAILWKLCTA